MKIISIIKRDGIKFTDTRDNEHIANCFECNGSIIHGMISCPDQRCGCCVAHWGYGCQNCKTVYNLKFDVPVSDEIIKFKVKEEIGVGVININAVKKLSKNIID